DLVDDRELVQPPNAPLYLVHPALALTQTVGEHLLGHSTAPPPVRHAATDRQLVHVAPLRWVCPGSLLSRFSASHFVSDHVGPSCGRPAHRQISVYGSCCD